MDFARLATAAALLTGVLVAGAISSQPSVSHFISGGQRIGLTVVPDTIAVEAGLATAIERDPLMSAEMTPLSPAEAALYATLATEDILVLKTRSGRVPAAAGRLRSAGGELAGLIVEADTAGRPIAVVTSEFIARFRDDVSRARVDAINDGRGVEIDRNDTFHTNQFVLRVVSGNPLDALRLSTEYAEMDEVEFSHPNFVVGRETRGQITDPIRPEQWHLPIIRAPEAWVHTRGENTIIAVIDPDGVEVRHEDLIAARFINAAEIPDNGRDDDKNGFVDDVNGWNFRSKSPDPKTSGAHGTAAAALAVATCGNAAGGCGVAPGARLLSIAQGRTVQDDADAFRYAVRMGADVISNSWGYARAFPSTQVVEAAIAETERLGRAGRGAVVLFAMTNEKRDNFGGGGDKYRDIASLPGVLAIGRSTDRDLWGHSGFGAGMAILAPANAARGSSTAGCVSTDLAGVKEIVTADLMGSAGYNRNGAGICGCNPTITEVKDVNYTRCFGGTSSATPIVAGVVALMLSAHPDLSPADVRRILAQTADRIDAASASYQLDATGLSYSPTHGWGRVNALGAVKGALARRNTEPGSKPSERQERPPAALPSRASQGPPPKSIGGKPVERAEVTYAFEQVPLDLWTDVRALVLSEKATRQQVLGLLGDTARLVTNTAWSQDLANSNILVVEAVSGTWTPSAGLAAAAEAGLVEHVGRVAPNALQQGGVTVLLNSFTFEPRPGITEAEIRAQAGLHGLTVARRPDGRYDLRPVDPLTDPIAVSRLADMFAASAVLVPGSLRPDFVNPVQRREE